MPTTKDDRFHAIALDAYPISGNLRIGLVSQIGFEPSDDDWFGTVGLAVGVQNASAARWVPFGEVAVRTGVGKRTFCGNVAVYDMCQDHLTLLWGVGLEAGVDGLLFGSTKGTLAIGVEKNQFFSVEVSGEEGNLTVFDDTTFTVKIGLGACARRSFPRLGWGRGSSRPPSRSPRRCSRSWTSPRSSSSSRRR
jgi:hypothetical protein